MEHELLKRLGMNENETKIYLFLLKTGTSTAPQISKSTGIDKATIYRGLDNLIKLGFASETIIDKIKRFTASPPHKLLDKTEELKEELEKVVPELQKLTVWQRTTAQVELYQGKEGIKTIMRDILEEGKPYVIMGHAETFFDEVPVYCDIWISRIEKKKVKGRLLCPKDEFIKIAKTEELRYLPKELTALISTWVYGDKTAQFIMTQPAYVVLIKNKEVAESNWKLFEYIWKNAKK
ncbi:MAG: helix-turn-helix domain-containing protein [Candidatus Woesearchaeota archaeon]